MLLQERRKSVSDGDWLSYGPTPGETRFSPLTDRRVKCERLGLVWSYEVGDGGGDRSRRSSGTTRSLASSWSTCSRDAHRQTSSVGIGVTANPP
jgi:glucose dehydrogenase